MTDFKKMSKNILLYFENSQFITFFNKFVICSIVLFGVYVGFGIFNHANISNQYKTYLLKLTYYYPEDATGSGKCTSSSKCIEDFTVNDNGWYVYTENEINYLVVAAATAECRDSNDDSGCKQARDEHGVASNIHYYNIGDTLTLSIGGQKYNAMVLDSCGACMWQERDETEEIIDIFASGSDSINPGIYQDIEILTEEVSSNNNAVTNFTTTYEGDIKQGYIYDAQQNKKLKLFNKKTEADIIENRANNIINDIFNKAQYSTNISSNVSCSAFKDLKVKVTDYEENVYDIVSFEEYIMGVIAFEERSVFLSNGNDEFKKAFIIAATSYVLSLAEYEEGMSEITIRSGTAAQGWCDIYKGCHQNTDGKKLYGDYSIAPGPNSSGIYNGYVANKNDTPPLTEAQIASIRAIMNSVSGIVRMENGQIMFTQYNTSANVGTNTMNPVDAATLGEQGYTYEQILDYWYTGENQRIGGVNACGEASDWKQYNASWGSIPLGDSEYTITSAGCLATSIAIQIDRSGTQVTISDFNPGTFVESLNSNSGFTEGGLFKWDGAWKEVAPNWEYYGQDKLPKEKAAKISSIASLLNEGYYLAMCVKSNCGHWVAVTGVQDENILISDPGSDATTVWPTYDAISRDSTLNVAKFKKLD